MSKEQSIDFAAMRNFNGILFDQETGKTYFSRWEDATPQDTGFTFERASWTGPRQWAPLVGVFNFFGNNVTGALNPLLFATIETALTVRAWANRLLKDGLTAEIDETDRIVGPVSRTTERLSVVSRGDSKQDFNAGNLAVSIIRHGENAASVYFLAEVRAAGLR